jgi:hypothetical protein
MLGREDTSEGASSLSWLELAREASSSESRPWRDSPPVGGMVLLVGGRARLRMEGCFACVFSVLFLPLCISTDGP